MKKEERKRRGGGRGEGREEAKAQKEDKVTVPYARARHFCPPQNAAKVRSSKIL